MLDLVIIVVLAIMAIRTSRAVMRESAIFREFNQPRSLALLVLLFPLGPIVYLASVFRYGWIIAVVAAASCYLPSLVAAKRRMHAFERAGTDRVRGAREAASQAFAAAVGGLIYSAMMLTFTLIGVASGEPGV